MTKQIFRLTILQLVSVVGVASAQSLLLLESAYELRLEDITFPASTVGLIDFRRCDSCQPERLSLTPTTTYSTSEGLVAHSQFQQILREVRASIPIGTVVPVTLFFDVESGNATRVVLHYGGEIQK